MPEMLEVAPALTKRLPLTVKNLVALLPVVDPVPDRERLPETLKVLLFVLKVKVPAMVSVVHA